MTTILIKKKDTAGAPAPGDLTNAAGGTEIAVNTATKRIYTKDSGGNVVELGTNATSSTIDQLTVVTSTTLSYGTANQVQYLNASKLLVGSANLTFNGTTLVANDFTDSSLTSGRVTYAGASGNLVDSANLTFNGTTLTANTIGAFTLSGTIAGGGNQINNVIIGSSTPLAGAFTTLTSNGATTFTAGTASTSTTTGTAVITGGLGVSGRINAANFDGIIGANTAAAGAFTTLTASSTLTVTGAGSIEGLTVGRGAGAVSTNTAVGASALAANTTGSFSTAIGAGAGAAQLSGQNIYVGNDAGGKLTTGDQNIGIGISSLGWNIASGNTTGNYNTTVGTQSMTRLSSGSNNAAFGYAALNANTTASNNTAVGYQAGYAVTTGIGNTFVGSEAGVQKTTGDYNTVLGLQAFRVNAGGSNNTAIGTAAGYQSSGNHNTFVGCRSSSSYGSGEFMTTGSKNTILGGFNGNQDGLDIRTADNYIVLSDGDGARQITMKEGQTLALDSAVPNAGTGITFPATQSASSNANTLDDYEEGTWTPSLVRASTQPSITATYTGDYQKIGNVINIWGSITVTAVAAQGTNVWILSGIPFNMGVRGCIGTAQSFSLTSIGASQLITGVGDSNVAQYLYFQNLDGALTNQNIQAGTLYFQVSYIVA